MSFHDQQGSIVTLGAKALGRGGEAEVLPVAGRPELAAKVYHTRSAERTNKLKAMIDAPPRDRARVGGHVSICWPVQKLFNSADVCVGFLMPRLDFTNYRELLVIYNPQDRREEAPNFTWEYLLKTAENLAIVVASVHAKGHVIGDLNESNLFVSDQALVTLVDCDSMQVRTAGAVYRCEVAKAEYLAPELIGKDLSRVDRAPEADNFALAILIFMLLMEGVHPYSGSGPGENNLPQDHIASGECAYVGSTRVKAKPTAPPFTMLPPAIQAMMQRAFGRGHREPGVRPTAQEWAEALGAATLATCAVNEMHVYSAHLGKACPWCARRVLAGGYDPFPGPERLEQTPLKAREFTGVASAPPVSRTPQPGGVASEPIVAAAAAPAVKKRPVRVALMPRTLAWGMPSLVGIAVLMGCLLFPVNVGAWGMSVRVHAAQDLWVEALGLGCVASLMRRRLLRGLGYAGVLGLGIWSARVADWGAAYAALVAVAGFVVSRAVLLLGERWMYRVTGGRYVKMLGGAALVCAFPLLLAGLAGLVQARSVALGKLPVADATPATAQLLVCAHLKRNCACEVKDSFLAGETAYVLMTSAGTPNATVTATLPGGMPQGVEFANEWHAGGGVNCRSGSITLPAEAPGGAARVQVMIPNGSQMWTAGTNFDVVAAPKEAVPTASPATPVDPAGGGEPGPQPE